MTLEHYFPVIELARKVRAYYGGRLDGQPRVCSDVVGEMICELNKIEAKGKIVRDEPIYDESMNNLTEEQKDNLRRIYLAARRAFDGRE